MQQISLLHEQSSVEQNIVVPAQQSLDFFFVLIGTEPIERRIVFTLAEGAEVNVRGIVLGSRDADVHLTTETIHEGRATRGRTTIKGLLADHASARVTSWIRIPKTGNNADSFLEERFLLLSPKARAKAEPMLEILANDVKASHAATVSRLNDDQLFYCMSRGIDQRESRRLLTEAFVNDILQMIPDENVVKQCRQILEQVLVTGYALPVT